MPRHDSAPIEVAIFGGDPVVCRALELRLRSVGYEARFLDESFTDKPAELLGGAKLVLLGPRLSPGCREAFLSDIRSAPATAGLAILELVTSLDEERHELGIRRVPWPCLTERLFQEIEATLSRNGSSR